MNRCWILVAALCLLASCADAAIPTPDLPRRLPSLKAGRLKLLGQSGRMVGVE